jgi:hypothetical protein
MNLMRTSVIAGALLVGGLGLDVSSARAQVPGVATPAPEARFPDTLLRTTPRLGSYYVQTQSGWSRVLRPARTAHQARPYRDPTGRDIPLAKPWLQPW